MKKAAFLSALSTMFAENAVKVVENFEIEPKTKLAAKAIEALGLSRRITVVTNGKDENVLRAFSNIESVEVTTAEQLNTYELVSSDYVLISVDAIKKIEEGNK